MKKKTCLIMTAAVGMLVGAFFPARTPAAAADGTYSGKARADVINNKGEHVQEYDVTVELTVRQGVFSEVKADWIQGESYEANRDFIDRVAPVLRDFLLGKPAESSTADAFDAVSGATYTSRAYREAVKNALTAGTGGGAPDADGPGEDTPGGSVPGGDEEKALSITLDLTSLSMKVGGIASIRSTVSPDSASVSWNSSDAGVAAVEGYANGALVTAKAAGTATITATAVSGSQKKTASCTVTVTGEMSDEDFAKGAPKVSVDKAKTSAASVTISWEAYPGAESYIVQRKGIGETPKPIATVAGDTTTYTDKAVKAETYYSYSVVAVKGELKSDYDRNCSVTTPKADEQKPAEDKPGRASIKSVTSVSCDRLKITWGAVDGAAGYYVLRSTSKNGTYKTAGTVSAASFTDSGLTAGKTYYYKVQAYNDGGKGTLSAAKSGKPVPAAPKVSVTAGKRQATVKWNKISGASGYIIYRSTSKSKGYKAVKTIKKGSTVSWKNTKLVSKKTYYYKVRAYRTVSGKKVCSAYSGVAGKKIK